MNQNTELKQFGEIYIICASKLQTQWLNTCSQLLAAGVRNTTITKVLEYDADETYKDYDYYDFYHEMYSDVIANHSEGFTK
jgi:hypothetical protein